MDESQGASGAEEFVKTFMKILKAIFKTVARLIKWIISFFTALLPVLLPIIAIIAVVAIVVVAIGSIFSGGYDSESGTMSSFGGIAGDKFYGQRFFYYDEDFCANDLADTYLNFTYNILKDINQSGVNIQLDFTVPYNHENNIQKVTNITTAYSVTLSGLQGEVSLLECTRQIEKYGFTDAQGQTVLNKMAEYVANNCSTAGSAAIVNALNGIYNKVNSDYAYMKNVCKKILIKDYLCETDNRVSGVEKKNYFGMVFMPKENVVIKSTAIAAVVDAGQTVEIFAKYASDGNTEVINSGSASETWFEEGGANEALECDYNNFILNKFNAFNVEDSNYLKQGKTLFEILKDGKFETYFKNTDFDYSEQKLLENINTSNYAYIQTKASLPFNMIDIVTEY